MSQGLLAAAAALSAQESRLDALADDIANLSTPGYRRHRFALSDLTGAGPSAAGVVLRSLGPSQAQGALVADDNPLAVAIEGEGYLQARLPDGRLALSRVGDLRLDPDGALSLGSGARLEPPVVLPAGTKAEQVRIQPDGSVLVAGRRVGALSIVQVPSPDGLLAAGGGLYLPTPASGAPRPAVDALVRQGYLEGSTVELAQAMAEMLETLRALQLASRAARSHDELLGIANEIRR
jgi:flagellar basal body rod protein FlgG